MKTREEVQALKESWRRDPHWDIRAEAGFEEYWDELAAYQEMCERQWEETRQKEIKEEKEEAKKLGLHGLYKLIKEMRSLQDRHDTAIIYLAEGRTQAAYNVLLGREN